MSNVVRALKCVCEYLALYGLLIVLGIICLAWSVIAVPLLALPRCHGVAAA